MNIVDIKPKTPEWHAWRAKGIGASESAIVLGISPYKTPWCVFSSTSITNSHLASITQYHSCRSLIIIHADHFKLILGVVIWLRL